MRLNNDKIVIVLAILAHEMATELDLHYEDDDLAKMAGSDGACRALRQAAAILRESGGPVSGAVAHVEGRMSRAYEEASGERLPPVQPTEVTTMTFSAWAGDRS